MSSESGRNLLTGLSIHICNDDLGAGVDKPLDASLPDARCTAGYDRNLVRQFAAHETPLPILPGALYRMVSPRVKL